MKLVGNRTPEVGKYYKFKNVGPEFIIAKVSSLSNEYIYINYDSMAMTRWAGASNWEIWELTDLEKALV